MSNLKIYSQNDKTWSNQKIGTSNSTIGNYGCLITCIAMACTYFGFDENPSSINQKLSQTNGYSYGDSYNARAIEQIVKLKETQSVFNFGLTEAGYLPVLEVIKDGVIDSNKICIIQIDFVPNTSESNSHYVIVNKVIDNRNLEITDPWTGSVRLLSDYFGSTVYQASDTVIQAFCLVSESTQIKDPNQNQIVPNLYYQALINDNNVRLAVNDLINRDQEIGGLKSQVDLQNKQIEAGNKKIDSIQQQLESLLSAKNNQSEIGQILAPNQKMPLKNASNSQSNKINGKVPADNNKLANFIILRDKIRSGHILEILLSFGFGFITFLNTSGFRIENFTDAHSLMSGIITALASYFGFRSDLIKGEVQK